MRLWSRVLVLAALALVAGPTSRSAAQTIAEPATLVPAPGKTTWTEVAATYSGRYVMTSSSSSAGAAFVQRLFDSQWDLPTVVGAPAGDLMLRPDLHGDITAGFRNGSGMQILFLDRVGFPTGPPLVINYEGSLNGRMRIGALAHGVAIVWSESGVGGVILRAQIGARRFTIHDDGPLQWDVATLPSGGCLVAWHQFNGSNGAMKAQAFDQNGTPLGAIVSLDMTVVRLSAVAVSPAGDAFAVIGVEETSGSPIYDVRTRRFSMNGTPLGPELLVATVTDNSSNLPNRVLPTAEIDFAGNLYVAWGDGASATAGLYVRAYDPSSAPFGPALMIDNAAPAHPVSAALMPDGRLTNAWTRLDGTAWTNVVSLCPAGASVCGDGVVHPACERCDTGPSNDDATPDACRTDCLPAHCGDGTVDSGEACDDGNFAYCDGCTPGCEIEAGIACGDGITSRHCGEQCDDGNPDELDGCTPACQLERIPGGGKSVTDCLSEWSIDNPTNVPPRDPSGAVVMKQRCVDDDPRCDFDGGVAGSCTFHVRVCANNTNIPGCFAPPRIAEWQLDRPSAHQAAKRPELMHVRNALVPAVPAAIVGTADPDACSAVHDIAVPLRGAPGRYRIGTVTLKAHATSYSDVLDKDKLELRCVPAS